MSYRQIVVCFALLGAGIAPGVVSASEHESEGPTANPVEIYTCNYVEGKSYDDVKKVAGEWAKWAEQHYKGDYAAWMMVPYYTGENITFDVAWLGAMPSGAAMAKVNAHWEANGGKYQAMFDNVVKCDARALFAALPVRPPKEYAKDGLLSFSDCKVDEGSSMQAAMYAVYGWNEYLDNTQSQSSRFMFFPAYGTGPGEFDFKYVTGVPSHEAFGSDWDQYAKSGWKEAQQRFSGVLDCDVSRAYRFEMILAPEEM